MRTRPVAVALLLALAPGAFALPASAQSAAEDPTTAMARSRFKEGVDFFDKGSFEQARASFLQAYALKKHPAVLLNLAWSCLKSGHVLEGERYFKEFLSEGGKDITDKQRADANDGLNQSNAKLGRIEVVATAGTDVTIDGEHAGTAPLADAVYVESGAHTVKFKEPDGSTDTSSVTVLAGEKAIARQAKPASAAAPAPAPSDTDTTEPAPPPVAPEPPKPVEPPPEAPPIETPPPSHGGHGAFAPPANMVPVVIGTIITLAGAGVAIGMYFSKQSAQTQATDEVATIVKAGGTYCSPPTPAGLMNLANACGSLVSDNNDVNADATVGNIAIGVGAAALAGTLIYYLVADKGDDAKPSSSASGLRRFVITPTASRYTGGLSIGASF
jgi:hypothetical protein